MVASSPVLTAHAAKSSCWLPPRLAARTLVQLAMLLLPRSCSPCSYANCLPLLLFFIHHVLLLCCSRAPHSIACAAAAGEASPAAAVGSQHPSRQRTLAVRRPPLLCPPWTNRRFALVTLPGSSAYIHILFSHLFSRQFCSSMYACLHSHVAANHMHVIALAIKLLAPGDRYSAAAAVCKCSSVVCRAAPHPRHPGQSRHGGWACLGMGAGCTALPALWDGTDSCCSDLSSLCRVWPSSGC